MSQRVTCQDTTRGRSAVGSIAYATAETHAGTLIVAVSERGVCYAALGEKGTAGQLVGHLGDRFPDAGIECDRGRAGAALEAIAALVASPGDDRVTAAADALTLDVGGTSFQREVWSALRAIPAGTTVSYAELATSLGKPRAARAVAQACGANPIAVLVPCHRVVGSTGRLTGYRWGVEVKRALLEREAASR